MEPRERPNERVRIESRNAEHKTILQAVQSQQTK